MKYIYILSAMLFLSCGNGETKNKYIAIYEFEQLQKISANDKQGTLQTLSKRLDKMASHYEIKLNNKEQIEIQISTDFNKERVNSILTNQGKLGFWEVIKADELMTFFIEANKLLKKENDSINPLYDLAKIASIGFENGLFSISETDTTRMRQYLYNKEIRTLLPSGLRHTKFLFGLPNSENHVMMYAVKNRNEKQAMINETHIVHADYGFDAIDQPVISIRMNKVGANRWERMKELAFQNRSQIAIVLNDIVYSAPFALNGAIKGGKTQISGNFTLEEAHDLSLIFGSLNRIPKLRKVSFSPITD